MFLIKLGSAHFYYAAHKIIYEHDEMIGSFSAGFSRRWEKLLQCWISL